jgi:pilus assembly protein Flp/PilA
MLATLKFLSQDESAATAVEYGLLLALIAIAALAGLTSLGTHLKAAYDRAGDVLERH